MSRPIRQARLLSFVVAAGIAASLAQGALVRNAAGHDPNGMLVRGITGRTEEIPALEKQQVDCANARPAFQGSVASASIGVIAPPSAQTEPAFFDNAYRPQTGLLRAQFGRASPYTFAR
jgi:hypothetical protein